MKQIVRLGIMGAAALCLATTAYGDVYDDAIFWFRGGTNVTANGRTAVKGDLFDSIHANDPSHKNHTASIWGYEDCRVLRYEDVQFPCNRDDRKSVPVLHLSCKTNTAVVGGVTTNMLFMPAWLARLGYGGKTGGVLFGFMHESGITDNIHPAIYCPGTNTSAHTSQLNEFRFRNLRIPTNGWFDVSLVVSGGVVRVGIARPTTMYSRNVIEFQNATGTSVPDGDKLSRPSATASNWRFFCENANTGYVEQPWGAATRTSFLGSVQQIAIWKRALSDDEVHEAWGWPHEKVFKVGLESPNIPPGGTWTVTFFGATNEVGLAQLLTLTATAGSAVGTISASVNGTSVGSQTIFPGRTATWYVPGTAFKKGPNNTLTLTRTGGSGNVVVDSLSIGGSWQIGIEGQDWSDMSSEGYVPRAPVTSTFDISRKHWAHAANSGSWTSNRTFRVWLPEHVAANYPMEFDLRSAYYFNGSSPTNYFMEVFVNGQLRNAIRDDTGVVSNRISTTTSHKLYRIPFEPGELRAGWNEFFMHGHGRPTGGYFMFDYYRFLLTGDRQNGTLLIVR